MRHIALKRSGLVAGLILLLELACRTGLISPRTLTAPSQMVVALWDVLASGEIDEDLEQTLTSVVVSIVLAALGGFGLGVVLHAMPRLRRALDPLLATYYAVPFFVFYPVMVAIFGLSHVPIVIVGFLFAVVVMLISTLNGLDRIPRVLDKVARMHRMSRAETALRLKLPAAAPHLFTGVKLATSYAFIGVIASEFIMAPVRPRLRHRVRVPQFRQRADVRAHAARARHGDDGQHEPASVGAKAPCTAEGTMTTTRLKDTGDVLLVLIALALTWQVLHLYTGDVALTSPVQTAAFAGHMLLTAKFWGHLSRSLLTFAYAMVLAMLGGIGAWLGTSRVRAALCEPILVALYSIPKVTLYPLILLVFGLGVSAKVAFGVLHGILPVIIFTMDAIRSLRPSHLRTAQVLRLSPVATLRTIIIPAALPEIVSGLRVGFSVTLLGVLIGEMFASKQGLGFLIMNAISLSDVGTMMAVTLILFLLAASANAALLAIDRKLRHS